MQNRKRRDLEQKKIVRLIIWGGSVLLLSRLFTCCLLSGLSSPWVIRQGRFCMCVPCPLYSHRTGGRYQDGMYACLLLILFFCFCEFLYPKIKTFILGDMLTCGDKYILMKWLRATLHLYWKNTSLSSFGKLEKMFNYSWIKFIMQDLGYMYMYFHLCYRHVFKKSF